MQFPKILFIASVAIHSVFAAPYSPSSNALERRGTADNLQEKIDLTEILGKLNDIAGTLNEIVGTVKSTATEETGTLDTDSNIETTLSGINDITGTLGTYLDSAGDIVGALHT